MYIPQINACLGPDEIKQLLPLKYPVKYSDAL